MSHIVEVSELYNSRIFSASRFVWIYFSNVKRSQHQRSRHSFWKTLTTIRSTTTTTSFVKMSTHITMPPGFKIAFLPYVSKTAEILMFSSIRSLCGNLDPHHVSWDVCVCVLVFENRDFMRQRRSVWSC